MGPAGFVQIDAEQGGGLTEKQEGKKRRCTVRRGSTGDRSPTEERSCGVRVRDNPSKSVREPSLQGGGTGGGGGGAEHETDREDTKHRGEAGGNGPS